MAVSLNSNGSYRADFMLNNEAVISQRAKQGSTKQDDGFAKLLDSRSGEGKKPTGTVNSSGSVNARSSYKAPEVKAELDRVCEVPEKEALVLEVSEEMNIVDDSATLTYESVAIPEDTMELARAIVNGDIDLNDVPLDRITFDLLKAILIVKKLETTKDDDEEEEDETDVFDAAKQSVLQNNVAMTLEDKILMAISLVLEENGEESLIADVEGVTEILTENGADLTTAADDTVAVPEVDKTEADVPEVTKEQIENDVSAKKTDETADLPKDETDGNVIVRKIAQPEETDLSRQGSGEEQQDTSYNQQSPISKEISEELEMLRNAKLGKAKTQSGESGKVDETAPVPTTNPLMANSPIMLAGKDGKMIEVRPSEVMAQVTKIVEQAISENREQTEYSMVLNPEELGRITVKLIKAADGAVSVTIVAENANTQRMLEQNGELMQSNLRANGIQLQSWQTVNEAHQETMQREYEGSSKNPYYREESDNTDDEQPEGESFAEIIAAM